MKRIFFLLMNLIIFRIMPIEWEFYSQIDWGKRFADSFDKVWPNIRKNPFEMGVTPKWEKNEGLRDFLNLSQVVAFSPFYGHFFGVGFRYFFTPLKIEQSFSLTGNIESWQLSLKGYNPFLSYRFYPFPQEKNFFLGANLGYILGRMDIEYKSNDFTAKANLNEAQGFSLQISTGYHFPLKNKFFWFISATLELQRVERLSGKVEPPVIPQVELMVKDNYLLVMDPAEAQNLGIREKAILWNNQLRLGLGVLFRLGEK